MEDMYIWFEQIEKLSIELMKAYKGLDNSAYGNSEGFSNKLKQARKMVANAYLVVDAEMHNYPYGDVPWQFAEITQNAENNGKKL